MTEKTWDSKFFIAFSADISVMYFTENEDININKISEDVINISLINLSDLLVQSFIILTC